MLLVGRGIETERARTVTERLDELGEGLCGFVHLDEPRSLRRGEDVFEPTPHRCCRACRGPFIYPLLRLVPLGVVAERR